MAVEYRIITKTADVTDGGTDDNIFVKLIGARKTTSTVRLDNPDRNDFERRNQDTFILKDSEVGISDVGFPIGIELSLNKPGVGAVGDGWRFEWIKIERRVNGVLQETASFSKSGWLDDAEGRQTLLTLWEDSFREAHPESFYEVIDRTDIVKNNWDGTTPFNTGVSEERTFTSENVQNHFNETTNSIETKAAISADIKGIIQTSTEMSHMFSNTQGSSQNNTTTIGTKITVQDSFEIPPHTLEIIHVVYTAHGEKIGFEVNGKNLAFYQPQTVAANVSRTVVPKGQPVPPRYQQIVDRALSH